MARKKKQFPVDNQTIKINTEKAVNSLVSLPDIKESYKKQAQGVLLLVILNLVVYLQLVNYPFIGFDDNYYIFENPNVLFGINWPAVKWAFSTYYMGHWHPITWLSYLLDNHIYGLNPGKYHLTNILIHIANSALVFLLLLRLMGRYGASLMVAILFAIHPLHIEPVAWISGRKELISTFFGILAVWAYLRYLKQPNWLHYGLVSLCLLLGLMGKALLITFPFALLLLDYWPLKRFDKSLAEGIKPFLLKLKDLFLEKWLLFIIIGILASVATQAAKSGSGTVVRVEDPIEVITGMKLNASIVFDLNVITNYIIYIKKMFLPNDLTMYYQVRMQPNLVLIGLALLTLLLVTLLAFWWAKKYPYFVVGWCWFLGTMLPMTRLPIAERYTYVPYLGLFVVGVLAFIELTAKWQIKEKFLMGFAVVITLILMIITTYQTSYWSSSIELFKQSVERNPNNPVMMYNLANEYHKINKKEEAAKYYQKTLEIIPSEYYKNNNEDLYSRTCNNLGLIFYDQGKYVEAEDLYKKALRYSAHNAHTYNSLAQLRVKQKKGEEAIEYANKSIALNPQLAEVYVNLGLGYLLQENVLETIKAFEKAVKLKPSLWDVQTDLGTLYASQGRREDALRRYQFVLKNNPNHQTARRKLEELQVRASIEKK